MRPLPLLNILLLPAGSGATPAAGDVSSADRVRIQSVIERQLGAFARDDGVRMAPNGEQET